MAAPLNENQHCTTILATNEQPLDHYMYILKNEIFRFCVYE